MYENVYTKQILLVFTVLKPLKEGEADFSKTYA